MVSLYLCSGEPAAGKSLIALALGLRMQEEGRAVGFFKPLGMHPVRLEGEMVDEDAAFIARTLELGDPLTDISPVVITRELTAAALSQEGPDLRSAVHSAFARIRSGKEVLIISGTGSALATGWLLGWPAHSVAGLVGARTIIVNRYLGERSLDVVLAARHMMAESAVGVIFNAVPPGHMATVHERVKPYLEHLGLPVLGVLPTDTVLSSISVRELARELGAEVLCCEPALDRMVEHFSVGAMTVESALRYFRRTPHKAVITGGDRADIQLAALDTDTRCLILTGDLAPSSQILALAEERGVPILLVPRDTLSVIAQVEGMLGKLRVREPQKVARARELVGRYADYDRIMQTLLAAV